MAKDFFTSPFMYLFGIFVSFVVVFTIYAAKLDNTIQAYVDNEVYEFVDESRASGYISPESYMELVSDIYKTGNLYDIKITHQSKASVPYTNEDGSPVYRNGEQLKNTTMAYRTYNKEDILTVMFPNGSNNQRYPLKNGDYLKVSVALKEPTLAAKLYSQWTGTYMKTIQTSYGGYVGSTSDSLFN